METTILLASVVAAAAPVVLASLGETLTEKAGVVNLSLDGTILLSAMTAFAVSYETRSLMLGFAAAALVGAAVAFLVALFSVYGGQSQVAVGFVLTLMTRDLAYFLGNPYARLQGLQVPYLPIAWLADIPWLGPVVFRHSLPVYFSIILVVAMWWGIYHTSAGLRLQAVGEHPLAAYARGLNPARQQLACTVCGGILIGLAGATFSLCTKLGWGRPQGAEGTGWIALALVIFGGWHPVRTAAGAYLFAFLQTLGIHAQGWLPGVPSQVFQTAPFPLMIFTLLLINVAQRQAPGAPGRPVSLTARFFQFLAARPPAALGRPLQRL